MKKNLTKKLMLSVLTLAFAVVSLGASTFAWFTMSGAADLGQFQGQVKGGEGVEIGYSAIGAPAADIKWKTGDITAAEIQGLINEINGGEDWKFDAVTPADALAFADSYTFNTVKGQEAAGNDVKESNGTYVAFALHFKLSDTSTSKEFHLVMDEYKLTSQGSTSWTADTAIEVDGAKATVGQAYVYDVRSAARVALISNEAADPYKALFEYVDPTTATVSTAGYSYKEVDVEVDDDDDPSTPAVIEKQRQAIGALELYNSKMDNDIVFDEANDAADNVAVDQQNYDKTNGTTLNSGSYKKVALLEANEVVTVNVLVWIEGWDAECLNALFSQKLALDLSFAIFEDNGSGEPKYN